MDPKVCPNCNANLVGDPIPQDLIDSGYYGTNTHWSRVIGLYSMEKDRVVEWLCPDCEHQWERKYPS